MLHLLTVAALVAAGLLTLAVLAVGVLLVALVAFALGMTVIISIIAPGSAF